MKILIAGDYCPNYRVAGLCKKEDFIGRFSNIRDILKSTDIAIVNFECPIVEKSAMPINKCGPNLKTTPESVDLIKYIGFNTVTLANNHFLDYGEEGVRDTLKILEDEHINHVGGGRNLFDASKVLYSQVSNRTVAVINCCEHEFSIAKENTGGANPLNPIKQYYSIKEARKKADVVLVIVHGGHEQYQLPSPRMKETYRFFVDSGADAVVNHHQHCYSGYEIYKEKPIFYGLGNFLFDWKGRINGLWNEGYMVTLEFSDGNVPQFSLTPYRQCNEEPVIELMDDIKSKEFNNRMLELNGIIRNDVLLNMEFENFMSVNEKMYLSLFLPYKGRFLNSLYSRGFLPSHISKKMKYRIMNYLECESHLDKLRYIIENKC